MSGKVVVAEATEALYVKHGTKAAKVTCDDGEGLQTDVIQLLPDQLSPFFSAYVHIRIEAGRVKVLLNDALGVDHPLATEE